MDVMDDHDDHGKTQDWCLIRDAVFRVFSRTRLDEVVVCPVVCQLGCHAMDFLDVLWW